VAGNAAVAPGEAATGAAAGAAPRVARPEEDLLFVFDENLEMGGAGSLAPSTRRQMGFYMDHLWKGATFLGVSGWDELFAVLAKYSRINRLVLFTHGIHGRIGMTLPEGGEPLGDLVGHTDYLPLSVFAESFEGRVAGERRPTIGEIHFEGCFLGAAPNELVAVKKTFSARRVDGYNLVHQLDYWSLPATYPERRSPETYAASKAGRGGVPPANSPYYLPGATDLGETIGETSFAETMWESFHENRDGAPLLARPDMHTTTLTTTEAEAEYLFDRPGQLHLVAVED
jgi:hypothetical protein